MCEHYIEQFKGVVITGQKSVFTWCKTSSYLCLTICTNCPTDWGSMFYRWDDEQYTPVEWSGIPRYSKFFKCTENKEMLLIQCDSFNDTTPRSQSKDVLLECYSKFIEDD